MRLLAPCADPREKSNRTVLDQVKSRLTRTAFTSRGRIKSEWAFPALPHCALPAAHVCFIASVELVPPDTQRGSLIPVTAA